MYEGGDGKNRETFPHIPDEPSKPRNFSFILETFVVNGTYVITEGENHQYYDEKTSTNLKYKNKIVVCPRTRATTNKA